MGNDAGPSWKILESAARRSRYVTITDRLIHRLERVPDPGRSHILYLDKSGRPVAWLVRALWPLLARTPGTSYSGGHVPPMPTMSFANIDREQWWDVTGASETGMIDVGRVPVEQVAQLRMAYLRRRPDRLDPARSWELPTWLDGRTILVVDEVRASGDTLTIAEGLVRRAFPQCDVQSVHWMAPPVQRDRRSGVAQQIENPVWYSSDIVEGRLVGNRMAPGRGSNWRGRIAPLFLSTVPYQQDTRGLQLRREVGRLARDVAERRILVAPAPTRDLDDAVERIRAIYGYTDLQRFTADRLAQS